MASFPSWTEWVKFREDNARKRAVRATLAGLHTDMPGSAAACPSTNPRAMKIAKKKGVVTKMPFDESEGQMPDYSFDRWVQKAKEFGDDVNKMRTNANTEDDKLDKKKKDAEKKADDEDKKAKQQPESDKEESDDTKDSKDKESVWTRLRQIHKERLQALSKDRSSDDSDDSSTSSS